MPGSRKIVLMLLDGLGDQYLCAQGKGSKLHAARVGSLTSVFPSTTAAAITSLMTGLAPSAHGLNGWTSRGHGNVGLFEPLPMCYCASGKPIRNPFRLRRLFPYATLYERLSCPAIVLSPTYLVDTDYGKRHSRGAAVGGYDSLDDLPALLGSALERIAQGGLIYVYVPHFDAKAHDEGMDSPRLLEVFERLDRCFAAVVEQVASAGGQLLATADHGLIDAPEEDMICLGSVPELAEMLAMPLWGERRAAFCAVRPGCREAFAEALETSWPKRLEILACDEVLARGLLGPGVAHRDLAIRVGDFLLLPRMAGTVVDAARPDQVHLMRAVHGGLSAAEMDVPLLKFEG